MAGGPGWAWPRQDLKGRGLCILEELGLNSGWTGKSLKRSVLLGFYFSKHPVCSR